MPKKRTSSEIELWLPLDRDDPRSLHHQLERGLRDAIRGGRLAAGAALPSSRALALQLGLSRGVVVEAYEQLVAEGYLASRPGGATTVARSPGLPTARGAGPAGRTFEIDFRSGRPDVRQFPRSAWLRSVRRAMTSAPADRFSYIDPRGVPELREAIAAYLDRVRGTSADPADVIIVNGFTQGLRLVAQTLAAAGARRIAMEDPCQPEARIAILAAGLRAVPIPVDEEGLRVDDLVTAEVDAVLVTPAHQYPTGAVMSAARRVALMDWAGRRGRLVIEDDYDAEFRYDREPIGSLQGLAPDRVVYIGSASKTLAPGLRLGWVVPPSSAAAGIAAAKATMDAGSSTFDQLALADFIVHGELDHHLRRLRPLYRQRRDLLLAALEAYLPAARPVGASAGLQILTWLPRDVDPARLVEAAVEQGIGLQALVGTDGGLADPGAVIFGYGSVEASLIDVGIRRLAAIARDIHPRRG